MSGGEEQRHAALLGRWPLPGRRALLGGLAAVLLLAAGGITALLTVDSPPLLTARVERRVLSGSLVAHGTVTPSQSIAFTPMLPKDAGAVRAVVTRLPVRGGDRVQAGEVLLEVSGRPVFALRGELPAYRDLGPGMRGRDVTQLQQALRSLGYRTGKDRLGVFGSGTGSALTALYASHGYDPLPARSDGGAAVDTARDAVTAAERDRQDAAQALADARRLSRSLTRLGTATDAAAGRALVSEARRRLSRASLALTLARHGLTRARNAAGPMLPVSEVLYLQGFPASVASVSAAVGEQVNGRVMTVAADGLVVRGALAPYEKNLIHPGQTVQIVSESAGIAVGGTVDTVAETPLPARLGGTAGQAADQAGRTMAGGYLLVVRPNRELDPDLAAQDVRLTAPAPPSRGPVLVVPDPAITMGADGRPMVTVYRDGTRHQVPVVPGTTANGCTEIRPVVDGAVRQGDRVILSGPVEDTDDGTGSGTAAAGRVG